MTESHHESVEHADHMKGYRVAEHIRPLAIVVFRRDDGAILLAPGYDRVKQQRFYRPLGGGIEFMERAEDAARREILEELSAEVEGLNLLGVSENIFTYLDQPGHEIVFTYEGRFTDPAFYERDVLIADESGAHFEVHWVPFDALSSGDAALYPEGLLELITAKPAFGYDEGNMGLTYVTIEVGNVAAPETTESIRLLVDSGSIYSIIPRRILEKLGIKPLTEQQFELANGGVIRREKGGAVFRYRDRVGVADVVFGEPGDANLLGAFTLEALGLALNPLRRELIDLPMTMTGFTT